ncbi:MAG: hypothetical protein AB1916_05125 [Thermodesulfobacteriota bacterium]
MRHNAIMVCKKKLGSADTMLPVFLTIKQRYPDTRFWILFPTQETLELNRLNHELWAGIQSLSPTVVVTRGGNTLRTIGILLRLLAAFAFSGNVFFKITDAIPAHRKFIAALRLVSRTIEVKCFNLSLWPLEGVRNIIAEYELVHARKGKQVDQNPLIGVYDSFFSTAAAEDFQSMLGVAVDRARYVQTGHPRRLPAWRQFLERTAAANPVVNGPRYCLFIMASLAMRSALNEPSGLELFRDAVEVLARHQDEVRIILKPHATTDVALLHTVMQECGVSNYSVEFAHAMVLSVKAEFVIGYHYSTTMIDAYFLGKPVIEYCGTDPESMKLFAGSTSISGGCHDYYIHRDKSRLAEVVAGLLNGTLSPARDQEFMERSFPQAPDTFLKTLDRMFG